MLILKVLFWLALGLAFYTYLGYGLLLSLWLKARQLWKKQRPQAVSQAPESWPEVTLVIAAYNEEDILGEKIRNCYQLDYPAGKLQFLFVTDGSTDRSPDIIRQYPDIRLMHQSERQGKIAAVKRAMREVRTPVTVFSDANTFLNARAIKQLVLPFEGPQVGAVAGEKSIRGKTTDAASTAGEGIYWRYESWLKQMDARLNSVVGAAGELYALRTGLFQDIPNDTILDDFMQTLLIAKAGFRVDYAPRARAEEAASSDIREELKRKIRICAGGAQSIIRLLPLLNPFRYGTLSFQYISHRVLRWTLAPLALPLIFFGNALLAWQGLHFYQGLFILQLCFYVLALAGFALRGRAVPIPGFFAPLYFCVMNYSAYAGFARYFFQKQDVNWEKARRAEVVVS